MVKEHGLIDNIKYFTIYAIRPARVASSDKTNRSYLIQFDYKCNKLYSYITPNTQSYEMTKNN